MTILKKHIQGISSYRTEIMGYAILGVMLAHIKTIGNYPDTIMGKAIGFLCYSVFTGGFVFLSGLGLYSSLNKNSNIKDFFKKRAARLLIPYLLISLPYFVFTDVFIGEGFIPFLEHITTVSFWIHGNYSGMWYISLSVVLYLLYPLIHRFLYGEPKKVNVRFSECIIGTSMLLVVLSHFAPNYYGMTSIAFSKLPLFVMGSYTMFYVSNDSAKIKLPPPPQLWLSIVSLIVAISICLLVDRDNVLGAGVNSCV